jgi:hypothetical protein
VQRFNCPYMPNSTPPLMLMPVPICRCVVTLRSRAPFESALARTIPLGESEKATAGVVAPVLIGGVMGWQQSRTCAHTGGMMIAVLPP